VEGILKASLDASEKIGYLTFSSDNWNVLHYAATRAALLDAESLPGHLLLRTLATMPKMKSLIESTTAQRWTPLHLTAYLVDYTSDCWSMSSMQMSRRKIPKKQPHLMSYLRQQEGFLKVCVGMTPFLDGADLPIVPPSTYKRSSKSSKGCTISRRCTSLPT